MIIFKNIFFVQTFFNCIIFSLVQTSCFVLLFNSNGKILYNADHMKDKGKEQLPLS